jgi:hypothetical protein
VGLIRSCAPAREVAQKRGSGLKMMPDWTNVPRFTKARCQNLGLPLQTRRCFQVATKARYLSNLQFNLTRLAFNLRALPRTARLLGTGPGSRMSASGFPGPVYCIQARPVPSRISLHPRNSAFSGARVCPPSETTHAPPPSLPPRPVRRRSAPRGLSVPRPESLVSAARLVRRRPGHVIGTGWAGLRPPLARLTADHDPS